MIRVRKGNNEFLVSKKTYEDTFKKLGYSIVGVKEVGVAPSAIPTTDTLEKELIETEKKENELKNNNSDVVTSQELNGSIGAKIEDDFGFEDKKENELDEKLENKSKDNDLYSQKLEALKKEENSKSGK